MFIPNLQKSIAEFVQLEMFDDYRFQYLFVTLKL